MNRPFLIWLVKRAGIVVLWAVLYGWFFRALAESIPTISPVAVAVWTGLYVMHQYQLKRYAPVLNVLPVSQRSVARGLWFIVVVLVPVAYVVLVSSVEGGLLVHGELLVTAVGIAASWSLVIGILRTLDGAPASKRAGIAMLAMLVIAFGLSTNLVPRIADDPVEGNIVQLVSVALLGLSYRHAERAWAPREFLRTQAKMKQDYRQFHLWRSSATAAAPAGIFGVYGRPAVVGAACAVGLCIISTAIIAFDEGGLDNEFTGGAALAIPLICMAVVWTSPYWLPNMRSLRLLPLSRARLTLFVLAYALSAFLGAPVLVLVGRYVFGWEPAATTALLLAVAGVYLCGIVGVIRFGTELMILPALLIMFPLAVFFHDRSATALIVFGLVTSALAYGWLYTLLGSGKAVYHRTNALNAFSPDEV